MIKYARMLSDVSYCKNKIIEFEMLLRFSLYDFLKITTINLSNKILIIQYRKVVF